MPHHGCPFVTREPRCVATRERDEGLNEGKLRSSRCAGPGPVACRRTSITGAGSARTWSYLSVSAQNSYRRSTGCAIRLEILQWRSGGDHRVTRREHGEGGRERSKGEATHG